MYTATNVTWCKHISDKMISISSMMCVHKPDWHMTEAEANARVLEMIAAAEKALEKRRAKLEALKRAVVAGVVKTQPLNGAKAT